VGGEPGIGKSTLLLQMALNIPNRVLYVSGEESAQQIKMRADRIQNINPECYIFGENSLERIITEIKNTKPEIVIIDSVQTLQTDQLDSSAGSISQIRECAAILTRIAKETHIPFFLIGHINKEGQIAGPKVLEHVVDTVLQFEGERNYLYRILRSIKNRFGSTSEIGIFEMQNSGLREVLNPSEMLLSEKDAEFSGIAIASSIEGMRPFLIEIQALVSTSVYGTPQRSSTGFDLRRLSMLLAVIEKRGGLRLSGKDVFLNIAGGIRVDDPGIDLAVVVAILSSDQDVIVPQEVAFAGEVGLSGEIRSVQRIDQRITEAQKLGYKKIFIPSNNFKSIKEKKNQVGLFPVSRIEDVVKQIFNQ
jgi:DNA repair protein RadA/Sms